MEKLKILPTAELNAIREAVETCRLNGAGLLNQIVFRLDRAENVISDLTDKFNKHLTLPKDK